MKTSPSEKSNAEIAEKIKNRGTWTNRTEFVISCLGYAVGLGNVWRFPYLCYKNGGGAFLVPYVICLIALGMPILLLEVSIGQFTSQGPIKCWSMAPIFRGIGYAMFIVTLFVATYYNIIIAWSLWYMGRSFTMNLPWQSCGSWSSNLCSTNYKTITVASCVNASGLIDTERGVCMVNNAFYAVINKTLAKENGFTMRTPASDFMSRVGLQVDLSPGFHDLGTLRWDMSLCLFVSWLIIFLCLFWGIQSAGKVAYVTSIYRYVVLLILLIRGLMSEGAGEGIKYYMLPRAEKLAESAVWKDAAVQIFFSLTISFGGVITYSSYNLFRGNIIRDILIVSIANSLTSILAGFVIFSYIGSLAHSMNVHIEDVATSGVSLVFTVYAQAVTYLPFPPLWSVLFFLMLFTLGLDSQFADMQTLVTIIVDEFHWEHSPLFKRIVMGGICLVAFLGGLVMCTPGGVYILTLMDDYSAGWNVMLISLLELICIGYVYGARKYATCIEGMLGAEAAQFWGWKKSQYYWIFLWCILGPLLLIATFIFSVVQYSPSSYGNYDFPLGANVFGWCISILVVMGLFIPVVIQVVDYVRFKDDYPSLKEYVQSLFKPMDKWGPRRMSDRLEYKSKYDPSILIREDI